MIEDLQDEVSSFSQTNKRRRHKSTVILFMLIIWILYATVIILASKSSIQKTLKQTNAVQILQNVRHYRSIVGEEAETLYFVSQNKEVKPYTVFVKNTGSTRFHNVVEALISGPADNVLKDGSITCIAKGTELLGLTVSEKYAFINFSQLPYSQENKAVVEKQLLYSLQVINPYIERIIIMVNGSIVLDHGH